MKNQNKKSMKKATLLIISFLLLITCEEKEKEKENENNNTTQKITCSFISPSNNAVVYNNIEIGLTVSTSETVKKVEYYLDDSSIGSVISEPYTFKWIPVNINAGNHKLTCIAIPEEGEDAKCEIDITVELRLGDSFKGGKIFLVDETGEHGLIASENDVTISSNNTFFWGSHNLIGASDINNGKDNTLKMANASSSSSYAGYAFKDGYDLNGYNDWYIPAQEELETLKENRDYVGGFATQSSDASYWSSTELSSDKAFALNFVALMGTTVTKGVYGYRIRPIREF